MNIGDYVRYQKYYKNNMIKIAKIDEIYEPDEHCKNTIYSLDDGDCIDDKHIIKHSPNIIDLIEVGDYLNGWRVNSMERTDNGTIITIGNNNYQRTEKLKSIVAKEQFENMEYKVND